MKNIILCDLDGTLADIRHRRHFVEKKRCDVCATAHWTDSRYCDVCGGTGYEPKKPDWPAFFKACVDDTPLQTTMDLTRHLLYSLSHSDVLKPEVWVVSGRSDEVFDETVAWLEKHMPYCDRLIMRKQGDYTPDDVLKRSWLQDGTIPKDRVFCVFDDRNRVVKMWREEGLVCYQVADGDF